MDLPPFLMVIYYNTKISYLNAKRTYAYSSRLECKPVGTGEGDLQSPPQIFPWNVFLQNALYFYLPFPLDFLIFLRLHDGISTHELSTFSEHMCNGGLKEICSEVCNITVFDSYITAFYFVMQIWTSDTHTCHFERNGLTPANVYYFYMN